MVIVVFFFFSSRRRHTRWTGDWSSDVCSSDLARGRGGAGADQLEGQADQAAAGGLHRPTQDRRCLDHAETGAAGRPLALAGPAVAPPQRQEATPGQGVEPVLLVQLGGPDAVAGGAGARPRREVARRGVAVQRPGAVGGRSGAGLPQALERGALLLRRQAATGLSRAEGVERAGGTEGAPDGVVRRQFGGAVV